MVLVIVLFFFKISLRQGSCIQAIINSVEMYLNHESLGTKFSLEIVELFLPETDSFYSTGSIK